MRTVICGIPFYAGVDSRLHHPWRETRGRKQKDRPLVPETCGSLKFQDLDADLTVDLVLSTGIIEVNI